MLVRHVLSQLSYAPVRRISQRRVLLYTPTTILSRRFFLFFVFLEKSDFFQNFGDFLRGKVIDRIAELAFHMDGLPVLHNLLHFFFAQADEG